MAVPNSVLAVPAPIPSDNDPPVICPVLTLAGETFAREVPELLKHHRNKWVAYHGATRLGIVKTSTDAFRLSDERGLHPDEIAIWCIEPQPNIDFIPEWIDHAGLR